MRSLQNSLVRGRLIGILIVVLACPSLILAKDELRSWADKSGKNKIKAKFVKLEDDVVTLEKEDGEEVEIELKLLSTADAKFASEAAEGSPFKPKANDPFKSKSKSKTGKSAKDDGDGVREIAVDLATAEEIGPALTSESWKVEIPVRKSTPSKAPIKSISIPARTDFFEKVTSLHISGGETSKYAVIGYLFDRNTEEGTARVSICDLTTGKSSSPAVTTGKMTPIALHDDGKQIVMRREEWGFGKHDRLEIWTPKGTKIAKSVAWTPYDGETSSGRDVVWAQFLGPSKLATCSGNGKVVIWKYPEIDPICKFETTSTAIPAVSPDRKLIAYSTGKEVGLFDVEKQEIVGQKECPVPLERPYMLFSPSGARLGCVASDKVVIWNTATSDLERQVACPGLILLGTAGFPDEQFVLAGDKYLIDLENQLKLWTYERADQILTVDGVTYFAVVGTDKKPGALIPAKIPHPAAKDFLTKALTQPDLFVLKSGTTVRIQADAIPDASKREEVVKGLTKCLEAVGCKAGPMGTIDLVASQSGPKDTEIQFFNFGTYKFKEFTSNVKFVYNGQPVWERHSTNSPGFVHLNRGENMEGHLRSLEKPNYELFKSVELPKLIQKPSAGQATLNLQTLGHSQVTTTGIR